MRAVYVSLLLSLFCNFAYADGFNFDKNYRLKGFKTITFSLDAQQVSKLNLKENKEINLNKKQKSLFLKFKKDISKLKIFDGRKKKPYDDCTCHFPNAGFRFSKREVEVPIEYIDRKSSFK